MSKGPPLIFHMSVHLMWLVGLSVAFGCWVLVGRVGTGWNYSSWGWRLVAQKNREDMARDYLATRATSGMPIGQVVEDLGNPDWTTEPDDGYEAERVVYIVGFRSMFFGSESVSIYFDVDHHGLVTACGFRQ
ncbi:MAG TPA: hypothetical protein VFD43_13680 [Planctomycetota bacterium]|nr:hypothetical protein [Planctomycetota bacterium]